MTAKIHQPDNCLEILQSLYVDKKLTIEDAARKLEVSYGTARKWLKEYGLIRSISEANKVRYNKPEAHEQTSKEILTWWRKRVGHHERSYYEHPCYVCGRITSNRTFCSRFCQLSPKGRENIRQRVTNTIKSLPTEIFNQRIRKSARKPNDYEKALDSILEELFPGQWKYVGDGQLIIGRKNPDWTNINGKKQLIELWGEYWHKHDKPESLQSLYSQYGYSTIIIWASELRQPEQLKQKLLNEVGLTNPPSACNNKISS